ncbi:lipopolysaccharide-induced tumor necrosis factor-alpha factor homolog [Drosophila novamexicana]|uniref:lipopolysaccharide-induced tumor necrosis factor-alpha factor homolog n=1 Tax=Drosophila novamexicana TaxID=47314 RepID=UPI0011E5D2A0|nr:lipopolysaccharide-induced tumor necrosis factor-alpha factor homolog [Drosophila novamexicana]
MDTKSHLYPQAPDAPPQYGDLGGPSMIPTEMPPSALPASVINVQQPQVYMQGVAQNHLGRVPTVATCPSCQARLLTTVKHEPSTKTHLLALLICLVGGICCCCVPYCVDSCQSAVHTCSSCGAFVGTYQN